jgi:arylformamidase
VCVTWHDVSTPIRSGMPVYPGDPEVEVGLAASMAAGDPANLTALTLGAHAGTHVDAPVHALPGTAGVEALDPAAMVGPARVIDVPQGAIRAADLAPALDGGAPHARRLLLRTGFGMDEPPPEGLGLTEEGAEALVSAGVVLIGIDTMSIGRAPDPMPPHRVLLRAGVVIVEGLRLGGVPAGDCDLLCLPVLVPGADGAPARVLVRPSDGGR